MMLKGVVFFLSLISLPLFAQKIEWHKDLQLNWENFKSQQPRKDLNTVAYAYTGLQYQVTKSTDPKAPVRIVVKSIFDADKSWKLHGNLKNQVLIHERKHFDITELYARVLRKYIAEKIKTSQDFDLHFDRQYRKIYAEYRTFQELYDRETDHGIHYKNQEKYNQIISKRLQELNNYQLN